MLEGAVRLKTQARRNAWLKGIATVSLALMSILLAITFRNLLSYVQQNGEVLHSHAVISQLNGVLSEMKDAETGARGYLLSNDTAFLEPLHHAKGRMPSEIEHLEVLMGADRRSAEEMEQLRAAINAKFRYIETLVENQRNSVAASSQPDSVILMRGKEAMDRVRATESLLVDRQTAILHSLEAEGRRLERSGPRLLGILAGALFLGIALLLAWTLREVVRTQQAERSALSKAEELAKEVLVREEAEQSWKRVLDSSPSGIMAFDSIRDEDGKISGFEWTRMNEAAEAIVHEKAEEMMNYAILEIHPENKGSSLYNRYIHVVESGEPLLTETEFTRNGLAITISVAAVRLLDGLVITFTDITEAKRQLILLQEGERLSVTGRFARMVGHEVRNPLTNIQLALDQLGTDAPQSEEQQLYLDIITRNAKRIGQLITEMLHTSRPLEIKMRPGSVNEVLTDAIAQVRDRCELLKVKIEPDLAQSLRNIPLDKPTLTIAFTNLLVNAVEATEEGKGVLSIRSELIMNRILVTVRDNGKGMSSEDRDRIFQPFFSGRKGGMGLGLTEARNIFNAHRVLLSVESELGKGTTFKLLFPA